MGLARVFTHFGFAVDFRRLDWLAGVFRDVFFKLVWSFQIIRLAGFFE